MNNNGGISTELEMNDNSQVTIIGNLNMDASAAGQVRVDLNNSSNLVLSGNVIRPNNFGASQVEQGSTITYNGTTPQILTSWYLATGDLFRHANVVINNAAGLTMELGKGGALISDTMTFTNGIITSSGADLPIFFGARALATGANYLSYVNGPVKKQGIGAFTFPTGKEGFAFPSGRRGYLGEIGISDPGSGGAFTAEYFRTSPNDTDQLGPNLTNISISEYWNLDRDQSSTSSVYVTLHWENYFTSGINDSSDLGIAHFTGPLWINEFQSALTTNGASGSVTTANLISTFSPFTFGSNNGNVNPLPVELIKFSAALVEPTVAKVQWATANELNNSHFEVMRSFNSVDFNSIETVKGAGTTSQNQFYSILDENLSEISAKYFYYKLKQVDFDGKITYSKVIALPLTENTISTGSIAVSVTPNPFENNLTVSLNNSYTDLSTVSIKVVDAYGRAINNSNLNATMGLTSTKINMTEYAAGIYYVIVNENGRSHTIKTVKH